MTSLTRIETILCVRFTVKNPGSPKAVGPGLFIQLPATVQVDPERDAAPYKLELKIDLVAGRVACVHLEITAEGEAPINGTGLRAIPIANYVRAAVGVLMMRGEAAAGGGMRFTPLSLPEEGIKEAGPTSESLRAVAALYTWAYIVGEPPAKAVEQGLGLPVSTAGRWIRLAREKGFLDVSAEQGRRA